VTSALYLGCPIWAYKGWVGNFYPAGTRTSDYLFEYARRLDTVEGNTTFYSVPSAQTLRRWAEQTPESFRFCPKLPRTVSHAGRLLEHLDEALRFSELMRLLGPRLGPLFLQLPPRYPPSLLADLEAFLAGWPSGVPLAVEVRHPGWFEPPHHQALTGLLRQQEAARVIIDTHPIRSLRHDRILEGSVYLRLLQARERKPDLPILAERTASFTFLRYIGHPNMEENAPYLAKWAEHLTGWLDEGADAYVFCHCPDERLDPWLCRELHRLVAARRPLPLLPWDELDSKTVRQERLF
jgi:uncharacterized protein YecE (DUF72 family)